MTNAAAIDTAPAMFRRKTGSNNMMDLKVYQYRSSYVRRRRLEDFVDGDGISESDLKCALDTDEMYEDSPELSQVVDAGDEALEMNVDEQTGQIDIGFPLDFIDALQSACTDKGGYFLLMERIDFVCAAMGAEVYVEMRNFVNCFADTPECRATDEIQLLESIWEAYDLECREIDATDPETSSNNLSDNPGGDGKGSASSPSSSSSTNTENQSGSDESAVRTPAPPSYASSQSEQQGSFTAFTGALATLIVFVVGLGGLFVYFLRRNSHPMDSQRVSTYEMTEGTADLRMEVDNTLT
jgi:hypothetical protein